MRVVDRFKSFATEAINDTQMQNMTLHIITNKGLPLAEMNPALVWIGAANATLKAGKSYLNYAKECEKTKNLEKINIQFEEMIKDEEMIQQKITKMTKFEACKKTEALEYFRQQNKISSSLYKKNVQNKIEIIEKMVKILQDLRENSGDLRLLVFFQAEADKCMSVTLNLLSELEV